MISVTAAEQLTCDPTYAEAMEQLWVERYTGPILVHLQSGQPGVVEKLNPEKIRLDKRRRNT